MAEKERMQPFWYQGTLIDPNEELPFPLEQLEAENACHDRRGTGCLYESGVWNRTINRRQEIKKNIRKSVLFLHPF